MSAYPELRGRTAIVTGVASEGGIGEAVALGLARAGACVAGIDVDGAGAERVAAAVEDAGGVGIALQADVTRADEVAAAVDAVLERRAGVDVLVNNAGGYERLRRIDEIDEAEWHAVLDLNLKSVFLCCRAVRAPMVAAGAGRIVSLASAAGRTRMYGIPNPVHYSAAKAGVAALTRSLAEELAPHGITVNAVAPGPTLTPRLQRLRGDDLEERLRPVIPLGRLPRPAHIAAAVLYLASDGAANVTGATLDVSGGATML